jgi:outer membrane protein TolC
MNPLTITVATLLSAALSVGAGAAEPTSRLTLDEAIAKGLSASHRLAELNARQQGASAAAEGSHAARMPIVSAQAGYTRTSHVTPFGVQLPGAPLAVVYPDIPDNYRTRLDLQWPIYTFGRADALERAARAEADATGLDLAAARNDLKLEITRAFWAVVTSTEAVRVVDESVKRMDAMLEDVRNSLKVGLAAPNDVLSVEAQRARQQMLLIQAGNSQEQTLADLRRLIGDPPESPIALDAVLESPPAPVPAADSLVDAARGARPDRKALETRLLGAADRREASVANRRPTLSVGGGVNLSNPNPLIFPRAAQWNGTFDASVNLSWTFWDFGRTAADIAGARAAERAARERLAEFDTTLDVEVRQRRLDLGSAHAAVASAEDSVRAAAEARRVVGDRFAAGVATPTDVLNAQVALLQAGLDRTQALASVRLAEARLARALGR